ncbi:MAG: ABC transporter ATP-binding protein [Oscillospiraceae bacterium]|jgi:iron(III) transport system ATP-binding protein
MENILTIQGLCKEYGDKTILNHLDFEVHQGEFLSVLGPSGCGKTTLLRILIGISQPTSGKILKNGTDITKLDPSKRGMGIVFQNYALFPNMTVLQNVEYALKFQPDLKTRARQIALDAIEQVGMTEHLGKKPHKLSGGQQQRVAIARTLALEPEIILFDEPMSALDAANRLTLRAELKRIQRDHNITMVYITHDQEEAFTMSDRIMVMSEGHIEQLDTPFEIYNHPVNDYVHTFVVDHLKTKLSALLQCMGKSL